LSRPNFSKLLVPTSFFIGLVLLHPLSAFAQYNEWRHGSTLFGELKYEDGFSQMEHVNPDAPKGGRLNRMAIGGFDSFNPFIVRGNPAIGLTYSGGILWDTLFDQSIDQPSASYGLIAEAFRYPPDYSSVTYRLNPKARWHDGKPITVDDVVWSLKVLRENQPLFTSYYKNITSVDVTGEREITFKFDIKGNRELPNILGDLPVLPKHWWEGKDAEGNQRDISQPLSEIPLGSGPYKISNFKFGETITYERVKDYWAQDLGMRKGRFNFDEVRFTYFNDRNAMWEGFKKGGLEDLWRENVSRRWATEYNFPAFEKGDVKRATFPTNGPELNQSFYFNTRKAKFSDPLVREAISLIFDFETMNKNLFFGLYTRTDSHFEGGELQAEGLASGRELEILKEYQDQLPPRLFSEPPVVSKFESAADTRKAQRKALKLFSEAGYSFKGGKLLDPEGNQLTIEFLGKSPTDERIVLPFIENLRPLGIKASLRVVDLAQYKNRIDNYDFDITTLVTSQSLSPGNEQREYWASSTADNPGARNYAGIKNPVVDALVERIVVAGDRSELIALTKALDRVLRWGFYTIPQWHNPEEWYAWWRKVQFPETQPLYIGIDVWSAWIDTEIEKELGQ